MSRGRGRAVGLVLAAVVLSGIPDSRAEPAAAAPDLRARALPFLPRLRMRPARAAHRAPPPRAAAVTPPAPAPAADADADPLRFAPSRPTVAAVVDAEPGLAPTMHGQLVLGFAVDGAEPSSRGLTIAGNQLGTDSPDDDAYRARIGYERARAYAFGDAFLGADGIGARGVSGYVASQFRIVPTLPTFAPVPTAWDTTDDFQFRAGWVEADGVFDRGPLAALVLRGGRQHVYGPGIAHIDGLSASWAWRGIRLAAYTGARVPDWYEVDPRYPDVGAQRGVVGGAELAIDLRRNRLPFQVRLRAMAFENHGHADVTLDWNARKDVVATATARTFDGAIAHEHVTVRYRLSEETRITIDGDYRHRRDPIWDFAFRDPAEAYAARRYLDRGPSLPRAQARARAGTVLLNNIDLLLHGAVAVDTRLENNEVSYHAAGFFESGGALEVRVRRAFIVGAQALWRTYNHRDPPLTATPPDPQLVIDEENVVQPLDLPPRHIGERNLVEGGLTARFSGGARKFSAAIEIFYRRTRWAERYRDDGVPDPQSDGSGDVEATALLDEFSRRGGGRLTFDAWVTQRLRLRAEYDISTTIDEAPEMRGLKALRVLAEGRF